MGLKPQPTIVLLQRSRTCPHQRSLWLMAHISPAASSLYNLLFSLSFTSSKWNLEYACVRPEKREKGKQWQTLLLMWAEMREKRRVCRSSGESRVMRGSVSRHFWGETLVHSEVKFFSWVHRVSLVKTAEQMDRLTRPHQVTLPGGDER